MISFCAFIGEKILAKGRESLLGLVLRSEADPGYFLRGGGGGGRWCTTKAWCN